MNEGDGGSGDGWCQDRSYQGNPAVKNIRTKIIGSRDSLVAGKKISYLAIFST
jgi:hypothetical protein